MNNPHITLSLLAVKTVQLALTFSGPTRIVLIDRTLVSVLESRRPYKGMTHKLYGKIRTPL